MNEHEEERERGLWGPGSTGEKLANAMTAGPPTTPEQHTAARPARRTPRHERKLNQENFILAVTEDIEGTRIAQTLTRPQLARRLGWKTVDLNELIDGQRDMTVRQLADISRALGMLPRFHFGAVS